MDSKRLRPLLTAPGPFASVYFEDSHDTQDADAQLGLRWRGLREQLEELGADESVPMFAVSVGASLVRTDERIAPADGIGAVLRYAPTLH